MNNKDYITALAERSAHTQADTQQLATAVIEEMARHLEAGEGIAIAGFGTFEVKKRDERVIINPSTQQRMLIPPKLVLTFKPTPAIKDNLKKG